MRGIWSGVSCSSAQPPLRPISTTRSKIRASSRALIKRSLDRHREEKQMKWIAYRSRSSADASSARSRRTASSPTRSCNASSASPTPARRRASLRDERQLSLTISAAATANRNPSARKFAPFSIARDSESGRTCRDEGGSPNSPVRRRVS